MQVSLGLALVSHNRQRMGPGVIAENRRFKWTTDKKPEWLGGWPETTLAAAPTCQLLSTVVRNSADRHRHLLDGPVAFWDRVVPQLRFR